MFAALTITGCRRGYPRIESWDKIHAEIVAAPMHNLKETDTLNAFNNKTKIVFLGYTHCPDVCPLALSNMNNAALALGTASSSYHFLFISIDPERDTVARLKDFREAAGKYTKFVRTSESDAQILSAQFGALNKQAPTSKDSENYSLDHSPWIYLLTKNNEVMAAFPAGTSGPALAEEIRKHQ